MKLFAIYYDNYPRVVVEAESQTELAEYINALPMGGVTGVRELQTVDEFMAILAMLPEDQLTNICPPIIIKRPEVTA